MSAESGLRWNPAVLPQLRQRLEAELSPNQVFADEDRIVAYGRDESDSGEFPPHLVVFAESTAQVSKVFQICQSLSAPLTPCGARSGKSGGSLPLSGGVALSLERMNRIKFLSVVCDI